ncbi:hypothetical protein J1614_010148 [Plenodomus biglobosus]|nr:hypothetical protein J1614_010148 [Plenodomus biglobosus]
MATGSDWPKAAIPTMQQCGGGACTQRGMCSCLASVVWRLSTGIGPTGFVLWEGGGGEGGAGVGDDGAAGGCLAKSKRFVGGGGGGSGSGGGE